MKDRSVSAPTYEELAALVVALQTRIAEQDARIAELERQLAASSRNSSKPPSSEGLGKPAPKSLRGRSGRKPGGQPGHEGRTLRQVEAPGGGGVTSPARAPAAARTCRQVTGRPGGPSAGVRHPGDHRSGGRAPAGVPPLCVTVTWAVAPAGVPGPEQSRTDDIFVHFSAIQADGY